MFEHPSPDLASVISAVRPPDDKPQQEALEFARAVHEGLSARPRALGSQYLYDARGSELFEAICEQPEYYPTRTEAAILRAHSADIASETGPVTVVELGAGTSRKTEHLLHAYHGADSLRGYVAVDVSGSALAKGREVIGRALPEVDFHALCATYDAAFDAVDQLDRTMLMFLGSTFGNFAPTEMTRFFSRVEKALQRGEFLLLGVDLDKDASVLEAAYNDAAGVTAAFTLNLFERMNRELDAGVDVSAIEHVARYNRAERQIEICAHFKRAQTIRIAPLGELHHIEAGERIQTEVSRKFTIESLTRQAAPHGLVCRRAFTDPDRRFALVLFERAAA